MLLLLGKKSAEERLAAFLLSMSRRLRKRGLSATDFYLSMSRHEIGNYLGLAVETVSRLFTRFQDEGLMRVDRKHIELLRPGRAGGRLRGRSPATAAAAPLTHCPLQSGLAGGLGEVRPEPQTPPFAAVDGRQALRVGGLQPPRRRASPAGAGDWDPDGRGAGTLPDRAPASAAGSAPQARAHLPAGHREVDVGQDLGVQQGPVQLPVGLSTP
jgi:hypothetical protein